MSLPTPYYDHAGITIYHGDCRDILPHVTADVVVTDPPYGVGKADWDKEFPTEWISEAMCSAGRVLCMTGNSTLQIAIAAFGDTYRDCLVLRNMNGMTRSAMSFSKWIPVIVAGNWKWRDESNVIEFAVSSTGINGHPSQKPERAMLGLISRFTDVGWTILDPFMGSGTTLVAAKQLGRKAIGIEIEERYCEIAVKRLAQEVLPLHDAQPEPEQVSLL